MRGKPSFFDMKLRHLALCIGMWVAGGVSHIFAAFSADFAVYQSYLDNLFTDKGCTELKPGITAANLADNENYINLPETLRLMAMKVATGQWDESYDYSSTPFAGTEGNWSGDYAKKYRVQLYEPYSRGDDAASMAGIQAYTNMNNPTGIVGDAGNTIYVMVRDAIPSGTSLYIGEVADYGLHNSLDSGTKLQQGLNIVKCTTDNAHFFIYYSAPTVKKPAGGTRFLPDTNYKLSSIPPIKIHIEGGRLNGFFNYVGDTRTDNDGSTLYTPDTETDFQYTVKRATNVMYDLIGRYVILHFHLNDTDKGGGSLIKGVRSALLTNRATGDDRQYNPVKIMTSWDEMCLNERVLMGLQNDEEIREYNRIHAEKILKDPTKEFYSSIVGTGDEVKTADEAYSLDPGFHYNDYFNNRLMGLSQDRDGLFMSATTWRMNFHINTVEAILTLFDKGDIWGPAHEYGHINQGPMNMAGTTEESNNIFSNVAVYFVGKETSRSDFLSAEFNIFQQGKNFLENGTWGTTRMFWQLWCYYHATGHNTKFYPRLYELLRNHPLERVTRPGKHNERYDQLQFAKMCCIAAEEDLTDFFTAWGFFVPLSFMPIEDYSAYDAFLTPEDIEAVKQEIAAFNFPKNEAIILIDDRPGSSRASYSGFPISSAGDFGGLDDFRTSKSPSGDFSFSVNLNTVTVETTGYPGAGYIIRDKEGNLLGFSNSASFEVNELLASQLRRGEAEITAVGTDNTTKSVTNTITDGGSESKLAILSDIIIKSKALMNYVADDMVGYIRTDAAKTMKKLIEQATELCESSDPSSADISQMIDKISSEYIALLNDDNSFVKVEFGNTYIITNRHNTNIVLATDGRKLTAVSKGNTADFTKQWYFEPTETDGTYYLKNVDSQTYLTAWDSTNRNYLMSDGAPAAYDLKNMRNGATNLGFFAIAGHGTSQGIHFNASLTYYGITAEGSQWTLKKIHNATDDAIAGKQIEMYRGVLKTLIWKYEDLKEHIDPTETHVGYVRPIAREVFDAICNDIRAFLDNDEKTAEECKEFYERQSELYKRNVSSNVVRIGIEPGTAYIITNVKNPERLLNTDDTSVNSRSIYDKDTFTTQWIFEPADDDGLYKLRNFGTGKYITSKVLNYNYSIPMNETGDSFGLIEIPDMMGQYGISANLDVMNSLLLSDIDVRLAALSSNMSHWTITKVHDSEYVELRDKLLEIWQKTQDLMMIYEFWSTDYWMDIWQASYDLPTVYNSVSTSKESLQEWIDDLGSKIAYCEAQMAGAEFVTLKEIKPINDCADDNTAEDEMRHAFNPDGEIRLKGAITFEHPVDAESIRVEITPIGHSEWSKSNADKDSMYDEYITAFNNYFIDPSLLEWFEICDVARLDGFFTKASGRLEESDASGVYDLIIDTPCSGLYQIRLYSAVADKAIIDSDKKIPTFKVEIYPNLTEDYGVNGINIAGHTFLEDDNHHHKTITIPYDEVTECRIYLPGLYFANSLSASLTVNDNGEKIATTAKKSASRINQYSGFVTIDLTDMKEEDASGIINIIAEKNGATANYTFNVKVGDKDVSTHVEGISSDDGDGFIYYNLEGIMVKNPTKGVYIRQRNGKSEKVEF